MAMNPYEDSPSEQSSRQRFERTIEPDSQPDSGESVLDSGVQSTFSLTSSISNFPIENGRRYHRYREGSYLFPCDDMETERLDLQHELLKFVFGGKLHFAPVDEPTKILDIGTGTGMWPIEIADTFPEAEIIGTDLSPIQPQWVPDNVQFVIDDANEADWLYQTDSFDYIHTRMLLGSFEDFREVINKSFKYTKPGGWMESQEYMSTVYCDDDTMKPDWPFAEWTRYGDEAAMQVGKPYRIANKLKRWYKEAGFVDVREEIYKIPLNPWPKDPHYKDIGRISELLWLDGIQALTLGHFRRVLGWSREEVEAYLVDVRKAIQDRNVHAYHKIYVVWGRKPFPDEVPLPETEVPPVTTLPVLDPDQEPTATTSVNNPEQIAEAAAPPAFPISARTVDKHLPDVPAHTLPHVDDDSGYHVFPS